MEEELLIDSKMMIGWFRSEVELDAMQAQHMISEL